ncbi:MAG: response regulator [Candidatus Thiodiazotropha sp.]
MNWKSTDQGLAARSADPRDRHYFRLSFVVSCVTLLGLLLIHDWPVRQTGASGILFLALSYASIRLLLFLSIGQAGSSVLRYTTPVFDQVFLGLALLAGGPGLLLTPLSLILILGANAYPIRYVWLAGFSALCIRAVTILLSPAISLDNHQILVLSLTIFLTLLLTLKKHHKLAPHAEASYDESDRPDQPDQETEASASLPTLVEPTATFSNTSTPRNGRRFLILSNSTNNIALLSQQLSEWGHETTSCGNSLQAFKHMLSRCQGEVFTPYSILFVDGESLDIEPLSLARLVKDEPLLTNLRLICIQPSFYNDKYAQRLLQAGYHTLLESPWSKEQLFSVISYETEQQDLASNVVSLSKHRNIKQAYTRQKQLLIADSPSEERGLLSSALGQAGYSVRTVENGDQALDALEEHFFDLAIINTDLPVMSGVQVVKLHRFTTSYKHWVPFIFLHDENDPEILNQCQNIGVDICLFKPVSPHEALLSILAALDKGDLQNLTYVYRSTDPIQFKNNRIQDAMLLDHMTLLRLEKLETGISFINELFRIFEVEGHTILERMGQAVAKQNLGLYLDQAQILFDSAGQLGAVVLYELSQQASKLSAREFEYKGSDILSEIEQTFNLTLQAYQYYLSQRSAVMNSEPIEPAT